MVERFSMFVFPEQNAAVPGAAGVQPQGADQGEGEGGHTEVRF